MKIACAPTKRKELIPHAVVGQRENGLIKTELGAGNDTQFGTW